MSDDEAQTPQGELKLFRSWMGWSQQDLADWLAEYRRTIIRWEKGHRKIPVHLLYLVRVVMRCGLTPVRHPVTRDEVLTPPVTQTEAEKDAPHRKRKYTRYS